MTPAFVIFLARKHWAERYRKLKYISKQMAISQSRASKDIALICRKIKELSNEDWESRVYGIGPDGVDQTSADEMISDEECVEMTDLAMAETADWDIIAEMMFATIKLLQANLFYTSLYNSSSDVQELDLLVNSIGNALLQSLL